MKLLLSLLLPALLAGCHPPKPVATLTAPALPAAGAPAETTPVGSADGGRPSALQAVLTLTRYHWTLTDAVDGKGQRITALFVRPDKPVQLDFNASLVSVGNACNPMSAHHAQTGDTLTIDPLASTMRACPEPGMTALDRELRLRLQGRLGMRFTADTPPRLVLVTAAGETLTWVGGRDAPPVTASGG